MFDNVKLIKSHKLKRAFALSRGDTLSVTWTDHKRRIHDVLVSHPIQKSMLVDEALLFEGELEGRRVLGGAVVEEKQK